MNLKRKYLAMAAIALVACSAPATHYKFFQSEKEKIIWIKTHPDVRIYYNYGIILQIDSRDIPEEEPRK